MQQLFLGDCSPSAGIAGVQRMLSREDCDRLEERREFRGEGDGVAGGRFGGRGWKVC